MGRADNKKPARGGLFVEGADLSATFSVDGVYGRARPNEKARRWAGLFSVKGLRNPSLYFFKFLFIRHV